MDLKGSRILVIGGAGFIGSHIVDQLIAESPAEIRVLDNFVRGKKASLSQALKSSKVKLIEGSITDLDTLRAAIKGVDGVFHLAALWLGECVSNPRAALEVNVVGTYNVMEACRDAGVKRVVYSSSASVYGNALTIPMTEEHPFNNRTFYGATKVAGEQFFRSFNDMHKLNYAGLRYMNVYGPRMDYKGTYVSVIMKVLDRIYEGKRPVIHGDGSQAYDFVHVEDVAHCNVLAMKSEVSDQFFNVGKGTKTTINELVQKLLKITGSKLQPEYLPQEHIFVTHRLGSTDKAEKLLGFKATKDLDEGLRLRRRMATPGSAASASGVSRAPPAERNQTMSEQANADTLYRRLARHPSLQWLVPSVRTLRAWLGWSVRTGLGSVLLVCLVRSVMLTRWLKRHGQRRIPTSAPAKTNPLIVMLAYANLPVDPRIEREARSLAAAGYRVKVLCPSWKTPREGPARIPDWGPNVTFAVLSRRGAIYSHSFPWIYNPVLLHAALAETDAWAFHAHDLDSALAGLVAAATRGVPCICDFHEWYSENISYDRRRNTYLPHSWLKRRVFQAMERLAIQSASRVITVCDSIAQALEKQYEAPRSIAVIRNIPIIDSPGALSAPTIDVRAQLGLPPEVKVLLYQGGVGPSRALEPVIQAMALVRNAVFVIRGPGIETYGPVYLDLAKRAGAEGRVFCLPAVPSARCVAEAKAADMGLCTLLSNCLNFTMALPNKVFEYLAAGLPLACPGYPEIRKIVETYEVGVCFDPTDPISIATAINRLAEDDELLNRCRANIAAALQDLRADREWAKLTALYQQLTEDGPCQSSPPLGKAA